MKRILLLFSIMILSLSGLSSHIVSNSEIRDSSNASAYSSTGGIGSGSFGFYLNIEPDTYFWISKTSDMDIEETEKNLAFASSVQEIGLLVLKTRERRTFLFTIHHDDLCMDGDPSKDTLKYTLELNDGLNSHTEDERGIISFTYSKDDTANSRKVLGSFNARIDDLESGRPGRYESLISVILEGP